MLTPAGPEEPSPETFRKVKRLLWSPHKVAKGEYSRFLGNNLHSLDLAEESFVGKLHFRLILDNHNSLFH